MRTQPTISIRTQRLRPAKIALLLAFGIPLSAAAEPLADQGFIRIHAINAPGLELTSPKLPPLPPAMEQGLRIARLLEEADDHEWRLLDMRCMGSRREEVLAPLLVLSGGSRPIQVGERRTGSLRN